MIKLNGIEKMTDEQKLKYMLIAFEGQISSENDIIANLSNASAIIKAIMDNLNWAGFYILHGEELVLGPFQGLPACNRIKIGSGVCGTAVSSKGVMRVYDVHEFEGHIACDSASQSEIVIPIMKNGEVFGVLDLDSPVVGRFTELEEKYLIKFVEKIEKSLNSCV